MKLRMQNGTEVDIQIDGLDQDINNKGLWVYIQEPLGVKIDLFRIDHEGRLVPKKLGSNEISTVEGYGFKVKDGYLVMI